MNNIISWKTTRVKMICECEFEIERVVPAYYNLEKNSDKDYSKEFVIKIADTAEVDWDKANNRLTLSVKKIDDDVYNAVIVILNVLIKREKQKKGMYILHASSVVVDNRVLLLFGSSGSGKTATSMHLCLAKKAAFLSNGSTVVAYDGKKCKVVGTYKTGIKIRKSTLKQYDIKLCDEIFGTDEKDNGYDQKKVLSPEQMHMKDGLVLLNDNNEIELYIIQLDKVNNEIHQNTEYDYKVSMQIYEDLARELDCSEVFVNIDGQLLYVPSFDDEGLYKNRVDFINYFMEKHYKGILMGGIDEVSVRLLKEE